MIMYGYRVFTFKKVFYVSALNSTVCRFTAVAVVITTFIPCSQLVLISYLYINNSFKMFSAKLIGATKVTKCLWTNANNVIRLSPNVLRFSSSGVKGMLNFNF